MQISVTWRTVGTSRHTRRDLQLHAALVVAGARTQVCSTNHSTVTSYDTRSRQSEPSIALIVTDLVAGVGEGDAGGAGRGLDQGDLGLGQRELDPVLRSLGAQPHHHHHLGDVILGFSNFDLD